MQRVMPWPVALVAGALERNCVVKLAGYHAGIARVLVSEIPMCPLRQSLKRILIVPQGVAQHANRWSVWDVSRG